MTGVGRSVVFFLSSMPDTSFSSLTRVYRATSRTHMTYVTIAATICDAGIKMKRRPVPESMRETLVGLGLTGPGAPEATLHEYSKGDYLCHEGERLAEMFYILSGKVKVSVTSRGGRTLLICFYEAEGIIGSIEVLTGKPATATAQAVTDTLCIAVPIPNHAAYYHSNAAFLDYLCTTMSVMFSRSSRNSAINILHPLQTRLCSYILSMQDDGLFHENLVETSELLGTSYRHLLRELARLCHNRILSKAPKGYHIIDLERLALLAEDYYQM